MAGQPLNTNHTQPEHMNLSTFISKSHIPARLIRATVKQMGGWSEFTEKAPDITQHGISGGFSGFIYYRDTEPFARRNRKEIVEVIENMADDLGESPVEMVRGFNCFRQSPPSVSAVGRALYAGKDTEGENLLNALAWFAAEEVARAYCDLANK